MKSLQISAMFEARPRLRAAIRIGITSVFVVIAGLMLIGIIGGAVWSDRFAYDFRYATWQAGRDVLRGVTPYVSPSAINAHGPGSSTGTPPTWFVYPAPAALLYAPFALVPRGVGEVLFTLFCLGAVSLTLRLLDVPGWRAYVLVFLWPGVLSGVGSANLSLLLMLGIAIAWRFRDRAMAAGGAVGLIIALKLFVWPIAIWLVATRRYLHTGYAVAAGLIASALAWAVIGFDQIPRYRDLLQALTRFEHGHTASWSDYLLRAGAGETVARGIPLLLAAAACCGTLLLGRRGNDRGALTFAVIATLAATPIMWSHYYALLLVPLVLLLPLLRSTFRRPPARSSAQPFAAAVESA